MPRRPRICPAETCFHVINRAVARLTLFEKQEDYEAFERVLALAHGQEKVSGMNGTAGVYLLQCLRIGSIDTEEKI